MHSSNMQLMPTLHKKTVIIKTVVYNSVAEQFSGNKPGIIRRNIARNSNGIVSPASVKSMI